MRGKDTAECSMMHLLADIVSTANAGIWVCVDETASLAGLLYPLDNLWLVGRWEQGLGEFP
jgi:hypothetical protein